MSDNDKSNETNETNENSTESTNTSSQEFHSNDIYTVSLDDVRAMLIEQQKQIVFDHAIHQSVNQPPLTCNYSEGYIRQPVYACQTCQHELKDVINPPTEQTINQMNDDQKEPSSSSQHVSSTDQSTKRGVGVCAYCAATCHAGHHLIETSQKRSFRCDCPTVGRCKADILNTESSDQPTESSVPTSRSPHLPSDYPLNTNNVYNHNFDGLFCTCNAPYNPETDQMVQCIVCEDWFHFEHVNLNNQSTPAPDPPASPLEDLGKNYICQRCAVAPCHSFLLPYWRGIPKLLHERKVGRATTRPSPVIASSQSPSSTNQSRKRNADDAELVVDPASGWRCDKCSFINKPHDDACFGCEANKPSLAKPGSQQSSQSHQSSPSAPSTASHTSDAPDQTEIDVHIPCTRISVPSERLKPAAMLVDAAWSDWLCRCKACTELLQTNAPWVLADENEAPPQEELIEVDDATFDAVVNEYLEQQPRTQVLTAMERVDLWTNMVMAKLRERVASTKDKVVTSELVHEILLQISAGLMDKTGEGEQQDFKRQRTE